MNIKTVHPIPPPKPTMNKKNHTENTHFGIQELKPHSVYDRHHQLKYDVE